MRLENLGDKGLIALYESLRRQILAANGAGLRCRVIGQNTKDYAQRLRAEMERRQLKFTPIECLSDGADTMRDMRAQLDKVRSQVAECEMVRDLAIEPKKRELFDRLAEHHKVLVAEIERAIAESKMTPLIKFYEKVIGTFERTGVRRPK